MISRLILAFIIFTLSWTDVAKINDWFPLYQFAIIILLINIFKSNFKIYWNKEDIFLVLALIFLIIISLYNFNDKTINYIIAYSYVFMIIYLFTKSVFVRYSYKLDYFMRINMYAVIGICLYSISEFFLEYLFSFDISKYVFKSKDATAIYQLGLSRSYGLATEPSTLALYINILGPLAIIQIQKLFKNIFFRNLLFLIIIMGWLFTFSASGILFLLISIIVSYFILGRLNELIKIKYLFVLLIIGLFIAYNFETINLSFFDKFYGKITLTSDGTSTSQRTEVLQLAISRFTENPIFGYGLGYTSSLNEMSPINWYLVLLTNGGLLAFIPISMFLFFKYLRVRMVSLADKPHYLVSYFAAIIGFVATSTFYNPFFWVYLAFIEMKIINNQSYD